MKKSVLALAVAAALAAPLAVQADTILYGSARVSVDYNDESNADAYWDVFNNDSRLGVMGSEDLGGGLSAVYQYEFGVDVTDGGNFQGNRPKFVGLKGSFGSITLGTQETPYYGVTGITDIFNTGRSFGATSWLGGSFSGYTLNPGQDRTAASGGGSLTRLDNSVLYTSPDFNGFSAALMFSMNGSLNDAQGWSNNIDIWNISAKYSNGPFFAGVTYISLEGDQLVDASGVPYVDLNLDQWAIGLGYSSGPFTIGFNYEQGTYNEWGLLKPTWQIDYGRNTSTPWNAYLAGSYTFGNNVISAAYGQLDTGISGQDAMQNYLLGYQYNFSKRTRVWVEYIGRNADDNFFYGDQNAVSIGTRVDF